MSTETRYCEFTTKRDGQIEVKCVTAIYRDGEYLDALNHRQVLVPGQAIPDKMVAYDEDNLLKEAVASVHTPARVAKFAKARAAAQAEINKRLKPQPS